MGGIYPLVGIQVTISRTQTSVRSSGPVQYFRDQFIRGWDELVNTVRTRQRSAVAGI